MFPIFCTLVIDTIILVKIPDVAAALVCYYSERSIALATQIMTGEVVLEEELRGVLSFQHPYVVCVFVDDRDGEPVHIHDIFFVVLCDDMACTVGCNAVWIPLADDDGIADSRRTPYGNEVHIACGVDSLFVEVGYLFVFRLRVVGCPTDEIARSILRVPIIEIVDERIGFSRAHTGCLHRIRRADASVGEVTNLHGFVPLCIERDIAAQSQLRSVFEEHLLSFGVGSPAAELHVVCYVAPRGLVCAELAEAA